MKRVTFLVDGFNLYHSIVDISHYSQGLCLKWLNIHSLCRSYLHLFGKDATLQSLYYFSAYATHLNNPSIVNRHKRYIKCLEVTGIIPIMGRFKKKEITCPHCHKQIVRHEEKETDVAIGIRICELLFRDECDIIVLITGDTDLVPAIKHAQSFSPDKSIVFAFPYRRKTSELAKLSPSSFTIHKPSYIRHQFPDPFVLPDGSPINKPSSW